MNEIDQAIEEVHCRLLKGNQEYGDSIEEIKTIIDVFNKITKKNLSEDDYFLLMLLTKIIRDNVGSKKLDNILDIAGYSVLWYRYRRKKS